ncbi:hypothetical protein E3J62_12195 [candidate division TA06 bacterium]|uniref:Fibronectin type-III domain-containing protein n=1 Tax=candidate division TA06 bacterium TaxID=2250710 RepID=A0A523UN11_UNCT6|nr:MAG: hypothetical protein E3J62_12195 [candidate division TA06 bacterium]
MRIAVCGIAAWLFLMTAFFATLHLAEAVSTTFFRTETFEDFSRGKQENISIKKDGSVVLSPPLTEKFESVEPYIWSIASDKKGNIYAGTGNEGKILKIQPNGDSSVIFDSPEAEILSMVIDGSGKLYAGTAPGGIIYRVNDSGGKVLFDSEEKYIWSMAIDKNGDLIAGTGDKGRIYRVKKNGSAQVILESGQTNITKVAVHEGKIYAGSAHDGILFLIDGKKTKVLYDTPEKEIRSILFDEAGNILVGTTSGESAPSSSPSRAKRGDDEPRGEAAPVTPGASAIYKVSKDGTTTQVVSWSSYTLLCMAMLPDGDIVVGTGEEGQLLRVARDGTTEILSRVEALQVLSIASNEEEFILSTGNMGRVYTLGKTYAAKGYFTSQSLDALTISFWGVISWTAYTPERTSVSVQTRSGNTEKPDQTWSDWSKSSTKGEGEKVSSPPARFLQWKAELSTKNSHVTPTLRDVSVAYLQKNLDPKITGVTVKPLSSGQTEGSSGRPRQDLRGEVIVSWTAEDPNGDSLQFVVQFKGTGQRNWFTMESDLKMSSHTFDSQSLPDGKYRIRVKASDSPSNPDDLALGDVRESDPFVIDNTPPEVFRMGADVKRGRKYRITFQVEDDASPVANCEYSIDGNPWRPVFPIDQIFDTKEESFVLETSSLSGGQHIIVVKATDRAQNIGTNRLIIDVK